MRIGSYTVKQKLGEGSFGRTFMGEHNLLPGVRVCIKQEKTGERPYTDLFREEAQVCARLRHPSLPSFIDYLESGEYGQVLLLSFIEGEPLDQVVDIRATPDGRFIAHKPIDDEHICWIVDRILGALWYMHGRHKIIHCDIKPQNVILDIGDHNATVVDLGMASIKPTESSKAKGGTAGYIPPEFATGLPPIPAADVYSTGKIVCAISGGDPLRGELAHDMHPKLAEFFEPWIRQDPMQRPQTCEDLRGQLHDLRRQVFGRTTCNEAFKFRQQRRTS